MTAQYTLAFLKSHRSRRVTFTSRDVYAKVHWRRRTKTLQGNIAKDLRLLAKIGLLSRIDRKGRFWNYRKNF